MASTPGGCEVGEARRHIENICLAPYQAQRRDTEGNQYRLTIAEEGDVLADAVTTLLDAMHRIADTYQCVLEASLGGDDGRHWD